MSRILVCGNRDWTCEATIRAWLSRLPKDTTIVHGGAKGADDIAGRIGKDLGFAVEVFPADWSKHGRAAGPIRNEEMAATVPRRGFAFGRIQKEVATGNVRLSGTGDMVMRLLSRGIAVTIIPAAGVMPYSPQAATTDGRGNAPNSSR